MLLLNLLVLFYIIFMTYWWSMQGLFSASIHLILTIMAGVIAFSFWEPLSSLFLGFMPESAWGIGLMLPFGLSLLMMRFALDKLVPGNLNFPPIADNIVGGLCGFLSGCITTGILIMGMQMMGFSSFFGYQPYALNENGEVVAYKDNRGNSKSLWLKVDQSTASFFNLLSNNAFAPILTNNTMGVYRKDMVRAISLSNDTRIQGAYARRSIRGDSIRVLKTDEDSFGLASIDKLPVPLQPHLQSERRTVVIGTQIKVTEASDEDGRVRIKPNQVRLNHSREEDQYRPSAVEESFPVGYIQAGEFVSFKKPQEYVRSEVSAPEMTVHWVFQIPMTHEPNFLVIKRARLNLQPVRRNTVRDPERVAKLIRAVNRVTALPVGNISMKDRDAYVRKTARLPFPLNKNQLPTDVEIITVEGVGRIKDKHYLLRGSSMVRKPTSKARLDDRLRVTSIYTQPDAVMLQVTIGPMGDKKKNLYHRINEHTEVDEAPRLVDVNNRPYWAMGYVVTKGTAQYKVSIDPKSPVRTMADMNLGQLSPGEKLILIFQLPKNKVLAYLKHGKHELVNMGFMRLVLGGAVFRPCFRLSPFDVGKASGVASAAGFHQAPSSRSTK